jgi:FMN-dependent NADH-azoreductase
VVQQLRSADSSARVRYRDLAADPVPASDGALMVARATPAPERSAEQAALVSRADAVMAELLATDVLVIGAPMYNFSIPSQIKAWIDLVSVAGVTFRYGPNGAEGMLKHKRAIIVATAGGQHAGQPSGRAHAGYLRLLLAFLGVSNVQLIAAEGLAMGPEVRDPALAAARGQVAELAIA